jgi:sugar lactone lactonase YvrE
MSLRILLCAAAFALAPVHAFAQAQEGTPSAQSLPPLPDLSTVTDVDALSLAAREAISVQDWPRYRTLAARLVELRPHNGYFALEHAAGFALEGDKSSTYDALLKLHATGWGFKLADDPRFEKVRGTEVWDYIVGQFEENLKPRGHGRVTRTLPADDLMIESLAWDPKRKQFLVGTVRRAGIHRLGADGKLEPFIVGDDGNQLWGVYDLAVDAERDRLWVATMASPMTEELDGADYGRAEVLAFELSSGKLVSRHAPPRDGRAYFFPALALSPDGQVFAADSLNRTIWRVEGGGLRAVVENPRLTRVRALAVSRDGKHLYVADYATGLFGVEIASGKPFAVGFTRNTSLFGIESLYAIPGGLVAVQNAMSPPRVVTLEMTPDGRNVARLLVVDAAQPEFTGLTRGTLVGDALHLIANTQRGKYTPLGRLADGAKLEPVKVWTSDLTRPLAPPTLPMTVGGR